MVVEETNMDECGGDEDTGTKVLAEEEDLRWNLHPLNLLCYYWKATASNRGKENDDYVIVSNSQIRALGTTHKLQQRAGESRTRRHLLHSRTLAFP